MWPRHCWPLVLKRAVVLHLKGHHCPICFFRALNEFTQLKVLHHFPLCAFSHGVGIYQAAARAKMYRATSLLHYSIWWTPTWILLAEQTSDGSLSNSSGMLFVKQPRGICTSEHWRFTCALRTATVQGKADDANLPPHPVTSAEIHGELGGGCQCLSMQTELNWIRWDRKWTPGTVRSRDNGMPDSEMSEMHWRGGAHWANNHSFPAVSLDCYDDLSSAGWFETGSLMAE